MTISSRSTVVPALFSVVTSQCISEVLVSVWKVSCAEGTLHGRNLACKVSFVEGVLRGRYLARKVSCVEGI